MARLAQPAPCRGARERAPAGPRDTSFLLTAVYAVIGAAWIVGTGLVLDGPARASDLGIAPWLPAEAAALAVITGLGLMLVLCRRYARGQGRALRALRESERLLNAAIDAVPAIVTVKGLDGRHLRVNRYAAEFYGHEPAWFVGRRIEEFANVDPVADAAEREMVATRRPIGPVERPARGRSGAPEHWLMSKTPVPDESGEVALIVTMWLDVTRQHQLKEQLAHGERLQAIGQLAGGIAHDFNNLLGVIIGNLELALDRAGDAEIRELLDQAMTSAARSAELTARLLAFGRKQTLQPRPLDASRLVHGMTGLVRRTLGGAIEIRTAFEPEPWTVLADPGQLEAAILNLVINARDAMPRGGALTLETTNRVVDETYAEDGETPAPGRYVAISVSDTGTGMAPEVARRAFEPFFTTKETGKGAGLGLSMAYGFARQSGGYAKLYSEPGHGTTVRLLLPVAPDAAADPGAASAEAMPRARAGEVVLLVEDTDALRRLVARQLEDLGYVVRAVADGPSALAALPELPRLDLLLTDVVVPGGMSGVEIAEAVRARRPGVAPRFMSGFPEGTIEATSHGALRGRLLNKPFRHPELARRVRAAIDRA